MFTAFFSIIIALLFYFTSSNAPPFESVALLSAIFASVGGLMIFMLGIILILSWSLLQKAENKISPRIIEVFNKDLLLKASVIWLFCFALANYGFVLDLLFFNLFAKKWILLVWFVWLGISLDVLLLLVNRIATYLSPFEVAAKMTKAAHNSIRESKEGDLCDWIDSLSELLLRAVERSSLSLCISVNNELALIARGFFQSSKSFSQPEVDAQSRELGISDKASYTLFFLLQRLEMIYERAIEKRFEPLCSNLVAVLGKITISAADYDWSLISPPLHFLGKWTHLALEHKISEVGPKAIYVLLEVGRSIIEEKNIAYSALKEPYQSIIQHMESITREMFRQNKKTSIAVLMQPFKDLKELLKGTTVVNHPDTPGLILILDRILGEFNELDMIMKTLPPVPEIPKDLLQE